MHLNYVCIIINNYLVYFKCFIYWFIIIEEKTKKYALQIRLIHQSLIENFYLIL